MIEQAVLIEDVPVPEKVAKHRKTSVATVTQSQAESPQLLSVIERIVSDPSVSIDRVKQAFEFYQTVEADRARRAYDAAFAAMQPELPTIERLGTGHNGSYARWEDIVERINPILAAHGFAVSFRVANEPGKISITAILAHKDGHREQTSYDLPADTSGSKNPIQAIGSTTSYGKRYTACSLLNIVSRNEDNDGQGAFVTDAQADDLRKLITATKSDLARFLEVAKAESVSDVLAKDFPRLKAMLQKKARG